MIQKSFNKHKFSITKILSHAYKIMTASKKNKLRPKLIWASQSSNIFISLSNKLIGSSKDDNLHDLKPSGVRDNLLFSCH